MAAIQNFDDVGPLMVIEVTGDHGGVLAVGVNDLAQSLSLSCAFVAIVIRCEVGVEESELLTVNIDVGPHGNASSIGERPVART